MSAEQLKTTVYRVAGQVYNEGRLEVMDDLWNADLVYHRPPFPDLEGREALREDISNLRNAFPDMELTFDEIIFEGDTSVARWTFRGTHTGQSPSIPVPPAGKQVTVTGVCVHHWAGGKIVEHWTHSDWLGLMQQLGVIPTPGQTG
jgi:steroid delta-isomerase-like uncharacterized protein